MAVEKVSLNEIEEEKNKMKEEKQLEKAMKFFSSNDSLFPAPKNAEEFYKQNPDAKIEIGEALLVSDELFEELARANKKNK